MTQKNEEVKELILDATFSMKFQHEKKDAAGNVEMKDGKAVMEDDKERTEIKFKLDFSKLSKEEIAEYAAREVTRVINGEVREGKKKVEEVKEKTIVVEKFEAGQRGRGKVTEDVALKKLAETYGIPMEQLQKKLAEMKGASK